MNVRKPVDYSTMFAALNTLMAANLPQVKLYCEIGRLVSVRAEKGAAVAAAEHLCSTYPEASGFSPRNLRRMREFYRTYENNPKVLAEAMTIGWTQNMVILEAELTLQERAWYIRAAGQFGWSKLELTTKIRERVHETTSLDSVPDLCYSNDNESDEDGTEKTSGTFLQGLWDAKVQRELQRQGSCGAYLQSLFPPLTGTAGRGNDAPPSGKSAAAPPDRERDEVAENRTRDHRPEVKTLACMVYGERFPRLARNQKKQELSIQTLTLRINGEICDSYGNLVYVKESYQISRTPLVIVRTQQNGIPQTIAPPPKILAKLLKWTVHTLEIFWWGEDYCDPDDIGSEDDSSLWSVHMEYSNGEIQDVESADGFPDNVLDLLFALSEFFE